MVDPCPQCGAEQPPGAEHCGACGADVKDQELPARQVQTKDIFSYSLFVIGIVLLTVGIPCLVGLMCVFLSR